MKPLYQFHPGAILAAALTFSAFHQASAGILINVDISSPDAVVFSTTNEFSEVDNISSDFGSGITLLDIFDNSMLLFFTPIEGSRMSPSLDSLAYDTYSAIFTTDLNFSLDLGGGLEGGGIAIPQSFATDAIALTGSSTLNLNDFSITAGRIGDIVIFESEENEGIVIGQWQTIPEPSGALLALGGSLGLLFRRNRMAACPQ